MIQPLATRDGYGKKLATLDDSRIVVLTADLGDSSRIKGFIQKYPERFIQCGISEQDMFGMANGLALEGKIPLTNTFAAFCFRATEQIRLICINNSNVKIIGHHSGITVGADGVTQQCENDIAVMRSFPNLTVVAPCDAIEAGKALDAILKHEGPCYLRLSREPMPILTNEYTPFTLGKATIMHEGSDVLIVCCGTMVNQALRAAQLLEEQHISALVMNMHTLKPLDQESLFIAAMKTKAIVTVEEHSIIGGLGSAVSESLSMTKIPIKILGINDSFGESGTAEELLNLHKLNAETIASYCHDVLHLKDKQPSIVENDPTLNLPKPEIKEDPRNRIVRMSEKDKDQVNGVLGKMFGGKKYY